ncbi:MAG: helix-turn-helix domain-containing protein [Armatimonadetes bacterium]|nr:helix-turn-helix domain-containing protein [Armatimonadota bacterium]
MEPTFGSTIRDRRKELRLSLREVADAARIDFTYLSKVETGRFPPPSEEVILKLSKTLELDADELLALANKVDAAIHEFIVSNPEATRLLRAWKDHGPSKAKEILDEEMEKTKDDAQES